MNKSSGFENIPLDLLWGDKAVRDIIRDLFDQSPLDENGRRIYGEADNITRAGCLALVQQGHWVWNAWREAFPVSRSRRSNVVDFSDHDFSEHYSYFHFFDFGDRADFSRAVFPAGTSFEAAKFGDRCNFIGTRWGDRCTFDGAVFGEYANFCGAQFGINTSFYKTEFNDFTHFVGSQFGGNTNFLCAKFHGYVNFSASDWDRVKQLTSWTDTQFTEAQKFSSARGIASDNFGQIDFRGAQFLGGPASNGETSVDFSNRKFQGKTDFSSCDGVHTKFCSVPKFHGCEFLQTIYFDESIFPKATGNKEAKNTFCTLKVTFSKQQAVREEQRFFRLEMEEETLRETGLKRWLFQGYKIFSDYGFSIKRPLLLLLATWLVFASIYGSYSTGETVCFLWQTGCELQQNWLGYSLQQALPLPGFDKLDHAIKIVPVWWLFLQKTISLAALFLIGLALRNLFKLK